MEKWKDRETDGVGGERVSAEVDFGRKKCISVVKTNDGSEVREKQKHVI